MGRIWTRGSSRVTILPDFGGSGQHFAFFSLLLNNSWHLNRYESSNTTFGLIDFLRYLIILINNYSIKDYTCGKRVGSGQIICR